MSPRALKLIVSLLFHVMISTSGNATNRVAKYFIQIALHLNCFRAPEDDCRNT
jgi:hypothetical protein